MFVTPPEKVIYCYGILTPSMQALAQDDPSVQLHKGFSAKVYETHNPSSHLMIVVDDLMSEDSIYKDLSDMYSKFSRHLNITICFINQNLYYRGSSDAQKYSRDILSNCSELVLFKNYKDNVAAMTLGKQAFPHKYRFFVNVYRDATKEPHSYLYLSFHPSNREDLILRTKVFYEIETPIIYFEKEK